MSARTKSPPKGFSIIEFMIAITLGALLLAAASSVYITNKTTYKAQEQLARLQENARYAIYILNRDIRMAGYQGCGGEEHIQLNNLIRNSSGVLDYDTPLLGHDGSPGGFTPALPVNLSSNAISGSDVIEVKMASPTSVQLRNDMGQAWHPILVYHRTSIQQGDPIIISNCKYGDIFIAGSNSTASYITHSIFHNTSFYLTLAYNTNAKVMKYNYYAFYVKDTGRANSVGDPIFALMRQDVSGNEVELVEGVEQMKITYGVDTDSDKSPNVYQTAATVETNNNWNNVISVQINLLLATTENVSNKRQSYRFNETIYTPSDRKLRREWQTLINIRNRGLPT